MRILCDLDDVLWELVPRWTRWLYMAHDIEVFPENIKSWDMTQYYPTLTREEVYAPLQNEHFFHNMEPMPGSVENVQKLLDDGHEVLVVTATYHRNAGPKIDELLRLFPMLRSKDVIITSRKELVNGDLLIDDSSANIDKFPWFSILMTRPHNQNHVLQQNRQFRCNSWDEIYDRVTFLQKEMDRFIY